MNFEYLSVDDLIRSNAVQDGGVGVQSMDGVESNAARPQAGFGGYDKFPDVWTKAGAYAHGIASTQYFTDGNKRTAWLVANIFLDKHGYELPHIEDIEAEAFINAVALDAWKADGDDATVLKAAEWFREKYETSRRGVVTDYRFEYAMLAFEADVNDGVINSASSISVTAMASPQFPVAFPLHVLTRVHWGSSDVGNPNVIQASMVIASGRFEGLVVAGVSTDAAEVVPSGHKHHRTGLMPVIHNLGLAPTFYEPADAVVTLTCDGAPVASIPFSVHALQEVPDHL